MSAEEESNNPNPRHHYFTFLGLCRKSWIRFLHESSGKETGMIVSINQDDFFVFLLRLVC